MAKKLITNYTFDKTAKTVVLNDYTQISLAGMLLITNVVTNVIIYNFADPNIGGSVTGNTLTLRYDTSLMNNSDDLQIFYDDATLAATDETAQLLVALSEDLDSSVALLRRIAKILEPVSVQDSAQRQRVVIDAITGGLTLGTVATVSNAQALGGVDYRWQMIDQARNTYANGIRSNLAF